MKKHASTAISAYEFSEWRSNALCARNRFLRQRYWAFRKLRMASVLYSMLKDTLNAKVHVEAAEEALQKSITLRFKQ